MYSWERKFAIALGSSRTVFLTPWFVMKLVYPNRRIRRVARKNSGQLLKLLDRARVDNQNERTLSRGSLVLFFVKTWISLAWGVITIAKRAKIFSNDSTVIDYIWAIRPGLRELFKQTCNEQQSNEFCHDFDDVNFGWIGNRIVFVDYGSPVLAEIFRRFPCEVEQILREAQPHT